MKTLCDDEICIFYILSKDKKGRVAIKMQQKYQKEMKHKNVPHVLTHFLCVCSTYASSTGMKISRIK